jgi:hypothetical protein
VTAVSEVFSFAGSGYPVRMDREHLPDAVPEADAVEQSRDLTEPVPDDENPVTDPDNPPLEAAGADWQEQIESVDVDPDDDVFGRS